jgi:hypothetical protein
LQPAEKITNLCVFLHGQVRLMFFITDASATPSLNFDATEFIAVDALVVWAESRNGIEYRCIKRQISS